MRTRILNAARVAFAPLLLVALAAAQLWPGLREHLGAPISWDHGAHLGKAMLTADELLPALRGWSDSVEAGVPLNTLYSVGGTAFILVVRALTPYLEWPETYALAVLAVRALVGLSVYRLARVAGGSRIAGFLGGVLALADHGDHSEGGWFYDIQFGVWPVSLAIAFLMFGLADVIEAREADRRGLVPRAAMCFGISLVSHQMPLLGLVVMTPLFVLMRYLSGSPRLRDDVRAIGSTVLVGGLLSSFWLVPMLASSDAMSRHGQLYRSFLELGTGATTGQFVLRAGAFTVVLCALAVLRGLFADGPRRFLAVLASVFIVISARDWLVATNLLRYLPTLGSIMYPRFLMLAKPLEFALAGLLCGEAVVAALGDVKRSIATSRGRLGVIVAIVVLVPFARGLFAGIESSAVTREVAYTSTDPLFQDFLAYARWERRQARTSGFYRVAYSNNESHLFQGAPAFTGVPAHKIGMLIAEVFGNTTPSGSLEALAAMNVRRVVTVGAPPPVVLNDTHVVATFGRIVVHDVNEFDSAVAIDPTGTTHPRVTHLERERVAIAANGARRIVVRRAIGPGWEAIVDGREVPLFGAPVPHAFPLRLMALDLPVGAREVELRYVSRSVPQTLGWLATILALGIVSIVVLPLPRVRAVRDRGVSVLDRWGESVAAHGRRIALFGALFVGLAVGTFLFVRGHEFDVRAALDRAEVHIVRADGSRTACDGARVTGEPGLQCPNADWLYVGPIVQTVEGELRQCVWAHPPGQGETLEIAIADAQLGSVLRVGAGIGDDAMGAEGDPVMLTVLADGRPLGAIAVPPYSDWRERRFDVRPGTHRLTFQVTATDSARRFLCFEATSR